MTVIRSRLAGSYGNGGGRVVGSPATGAIGKSGRVDRAPAPCETAAPYFAMSSAVVEDFGDPSETERVDMTEVEMLIGGGVEGSVGV